MLFTAYSSRFYFDAYLESAFTNKTLSKEIIELYKNCFSLSVLQHCSFQLTLSFFL